MLHGEAAQVARLAGAKNHLVGRGREVAELLGLMRGARLITVTGLPGVGKTAVGIVGATLAAPGYPDGVWPVVLGPLRDEALVPHTVAQALRVPDYYSRGRMESLAAELRDRRMLLILDTCEHLVRGCASLVAELLGVCPHLRILATSRRRLRLPDEHVLTVQPLTLGRAIVLFGQRAREATAAFRITSADRPVVASICRRLDRLPLAIELAARRLESVSLGRLLSDLDEGFGLLRGGADSSSRHQSLCAAIGWSHQLCTPAERLLWARLSVFGEPFQLPGAVTVCADDHLPGPVVAGAISGLVSQSVLMVEAGTAQPGAHDRSGEWYRVPETIRAYGAAMLQRLGEEGQARHRYQAWQAGRC
jgi:predicted ATPase